MRHEGLQAALLERSFCYDVMMLAPMGFQKSIIQPGGLWTADLRTRYVPDVIKSVMRTYEDPSSKRMKKGAAAIPPRYRIAARTVGPDDLSA